MCLCELRLSLMRRRALCAALASLALGSIWPMVYLTLMVLGLWVSASMRVKEKSLSRYPEWDAYKARTWAFVPGVW